MFETIADTILATVFILLCFCNVFVLLLWLRLVWLVPAVLAFMLYDDYVTSLAFHKYLDAHCHRGDTRP